MQGNRSTPSRAGNLDDLDTGLIDALKRNPRTTNRALAKVLGCSVGTVAARLRRLSRQRVMRVLGIISSRSLGYEQLTMLWVQVRGRSVEKVAIDLSAIPQVVAVASLFGAYELIVTLVSKDRRDLSRLLLEQIPSIRGVAAMRSDTCLELVRYYPDWALLDDELLARHEGTDLRKLMVDADDLDLRIIEIVQGDGRISNRAIARQVGAAEGTVRYRLRRLEESGQLRFRAVTNPAKLGLLRSAFVGLEVEPDRIGAIARTVAEIDRVGMVAVTLGRQDISAFVLAHDRDELVRTIEDRMMGLVGVRRTDTSEVIRSFKHAYLLSFEF